MVASHLMLGFGLIALSYWLDRSVNSGFEDRTDGSEIDQQYFASRHRRRRRVNFILGLCGVLIVIAGVGEPRIFIGCWLLVTIALMAVVFLAAIDVLRTQRYHDQKLPEIRRRMLEGDKRKDG